MAAESSQNSRENIVHTPPYVNTPSTPHLYFAFGSNLSTTQMKHRCPSSVALGVARLDGWRWVINERGYANIVENAADPLSDGDGPSDDDKVVWGLVYTLPPEEEKKLDRYEGVPDSYGKEYLDLKSWSLLKDSEGAGSSATETVPLQNAAGAVKVVGGATPDLDDSKAITKQALAYVDRTRLGRTPCESQKEYIPRMRRGVAESEALGVPGSWMKRVFGRWIDMSGL